MDRVDVFGKPPSLRQPTIFTQTNMATRFARVQSPWTSSCPIALGRQNGEANLDRIALRS
jgi:hypothetical protein